jgi:hemerythrin-like domain-containing protein
MTAMHTSQAARPDTRDMIVVHNVFRRLFGDMPGLVRGAADGDTARAATLCDCISELTNGLRHHHTTEDEMLWPLLLERLDAEQAVVLRAEEQHERVHELLELVQVQIIPFRSGARPADRDAVAATMAELDTVLREHMADEERYVLPLVEAHLTAAEWEAVGDRGRASIPKDRLLIQLGWILEGVPADERRQFLSHLPVSARIAWRLIGRRKWAKERAAVYGN